MKIIKDSLAQDELRRMASEGFGDMVKAVVDIEKGVLAVDANLHSDLEALLLEAGSIQENLWGINLYPDLQGDDFIEFDSMINLRPSRGNRSRGVENVKVRKKISEMISRMIR